MIDQLIYGLLGFSFWQYIIYTVIAIHVTVIGVTVYLHRCQAHRALELHPVICHFFRLWIWMSSGMNTGVWVAIHRKHHTFVETKDDPHSPVVMGINKVLLEGAELYREEKKNEETMARFSKGTPDDWLERHVYLGYPRLGVVALLFINMVLFGIPGITIWGFQMMSMPVLAAGIINGIGHYWGYRNFESPDASTNIVPWGIIMGGEELHNNHHAFASSAKLSVKKWEFDMGWMYIRLFEMLGLAKVYRTVPELHTNPAKANVDSDSLGALVSHRLQVMDQYWHCVVLPIFNERKKQADRAHKKLFRWARRLLIKDESTINNEERQQLQQLLSYESALKTIYEMRLQLQDIWHRSSVSQAEMLEKLREWCQRAEATGIKALQDFVDVIKSYTLQPDATAA